MESIFVLIGGALLTIPIIAIVALVRTSSLRRLLDERTDEQQRAISTLEREIAGLRRTLAQAQVTKPAAFPAEPSVAATPPLPIAKPVPPLEPPKPPPETWEQRMTKLAATAESKPLSPPAPVKLPELAPLPAPSPTASVSHAVLTPVAPLQAPPQNAAPPPIPLPPPAPRPAYAPAYEPAPHGPSLYERLRGVIPLEELLGMNLFAKIGMILLVLGFALLGRVALVSMGPAGKVALIYAAAFTLLGGGVWLERKERYRLIGRTGIGGGWALVFFTTYAMHHVAAMLVMPSEIVNSVLLLGVAIAIVVHTLRYESQLVTGLAFLLAFSTVALTQDTVYALSAGVILAIGIGAIALRMGWFELEIFGILASFGNHFYWLYKLYPDGVAGHPFPQFLPSAVILLLYWLTFRISYIVRTIRTPRDEKTSTIAALVNTTLLLAVMKFQSTHPELAFYALLALGALEFLFGQLPITRRRRPAFVLLTVLGTMLMFAAVPSKFSGNNIALLWMIAAEALLIAGIVQAEVVFRRLGLLAGTITGALIVFEARRILELRQSSEAPLTHDGVLLLACSVLFYGNALFVRDKWRALFESYDGQCIAVQSYLGGITAFLGIWGIFTGDWTAPAWAVLMLAVVFGTRRLSDRDLLAQGWVLTIAVAVRAALVNSHMGTQYPHHVTLRLITLPLLSLMFYIAATLLPRAQDWPRADLRTLNLWLGSSLLVALVWFELSPLWIAPVWTALAVAFALTGRRLKLSTLCYQEHLLAALVAFQLLYVNLNANATIERYFPFLFCAGVFYAVSRFCTMPDAPYRRIAAWSHTWAATGLLATLAWQCSPQPWLAPLWAVFALSLAMVDRVFDVEELPYQAHVLAALAVTRAVTSNLYSVDKWHAIDVRLLTVSIVVLVLYALTRWVRIPQALRDREMHHAYSWAGSILAAWMLWSELQPIAVAVGLAVFGLLLFEWGVFQKQRQLRLQSYVSLAAAFGRIFFVNLTAATLPGETLSPRIYTVVPIALIFFYIWMRLQSESPAAERERSPAANLLAYFGTGCIIALLYFQVTPEWIVVSWAIAVLVLMAAALVLDKEVFLQHAALLTVGIVGRGIAHNIFGSSYFDANGWRGNLAVLTLASVLLLAALPLAFKLRKRYAARPTPSLISRYLALNHPEQLLFFAPILLITLMIFVKMNPGMVTLSWGLEGVLVILLGLAVGQRSYRLTGLLLLLLCVAKIILRDAWQLSERDRYITFIVLGAALTLVSMLYNRFRETIGRLL